MDAILNRNCIIRKHYEDVWQRRGRISDFGGGKSSDLPPEFTVLEFGPDDKRELWTYATCSMSAPDDKEALELHIHSKRRGDEAVELLFLVAHFHRTACQLGLHHTVSFGKPWIKNSNCEYGFISLPYLDGPALEVFSILNQPAKALWLLPITFGERQLKIEQGIDELEAKFELENLDYANPLRSSVV